MDPEIDSAAKSKVGVAVLVLVVVALGFYLIWRYSDQGEKKGEETTSPTLGQQISGQTQTPTDSVPDVNPYKTETNPFEKTNPLKNIYKNPFGP